MSNQPESKGYLKYVIAASVLATAFGNMFAVRRLAHKVPKAPRGFYKEDAGWVDPKMTKGPKPMGKTGKSEKYKTENPDPRARERWRAYHDAKEQQQRTKEAYGFMGRRQHNLSGVPRSVAIHLEVLGLPTTEMPSREAVAAAYRAVAMQHHPDRVASDDPKRVESEKKFKAASDAYAQLGAWFDRSG